MRLWKDYTTHMPTLIKLVQMTDGPVLEFGSGLFSTPLLHWLCAEKKRRLETHEANEDYFRFANKFRSGNHKIYLVEDWDLVGLGRHWSVVLIDHEDERRSVDALRMKDNADFVVLHDSETDHYGYEEVYLHFKHVHHWKDCRPWTTVLSNHKEIIGL